MPTVNQILNANLSDVPSTVCPEFTERITSDILTGQQFFDEIEQFKAAMCVMTYTASRNGGTKLNVERLIHARGFYPAYARRFVANVHTKLFIVMNTTIPWVAYVGSQNLCAPTQANLMVRITDSHTIASLFRYFNFFWSSSPSEPDSPRVQTKTNKKHKHVRRKRSS